MTSSVMATQVLMIVTNNCGVMISVLASGAVDRGFAPRSGQTKHYIIGMCCFSAEHATLRSKSKDWWARNQNNVSEWSDIEEITNELSRTHDLPHPMRAR
jgi:hypothetical protein